MKQSTSLVATLSCAQAIKLAVESKLDFLGDIGGAFTDFGDIMETGFTDFGDMTIGGLEDFGDIMVDGYDITIGGLEDFGDIMGDGIDIMGDGLEDFGNMTVDGFNDFGDMTVDAFDTSVGLVGDGIMYVADPLVDPFNDFGDFVVDDIGGFIVDDIGGGLTDAYDWASNEGNWEAFGKTYLGGWVKFFEGDFETAGQIWGNEDLYTEEGYEELDRKKKEYEAAVAKQKENEKKHQENILMCHDRLAQYEVLEVEQAQEQDRIIKEKYDEYLVDYQANVQEATENYENQYATAKAEYDAQRDPIIEQYDSIVASRAGYCASSSKPIGSTFEVPIKDTDLTTQMTKTQYFSYSLGSGAANWAWATLFDSSKVTRESCEREDCLHRCHGTAMTANCGQCYDQIDKYAKQGLLGHPQVQEALKETCNKCAVPPAADQELPPEFQAYVAPTFKEPKTFVEYEDALLDAIEEAEQEPVDESNLTPEELEKKQNKEKVENFCKEYVPEYAAYFASREN